MLRSGKNMPKFLFDYGKIKCECAKVDFDNGKAKHSFAKDDLACGTYDFLLTINTSLSENSIHAKS
jgi:hypothetical protein